MVGCQQQDPVSIAVDQAGGSQMLLIPKGVFKLILFEPALPDGGNTLPAEGISGIVSAAQGKIIGCDSEWKGLRGRVQQKGALLL